MYFHLSWKVCITRSSETVSTIDLKLQLYIFQGVNMCIWLFFTHSVWTLMQLLALVWIKYGLLSLYHTQLQHRLYNRLLGYSVQVVTLRTDVFSSNWFQHGWSYRSWFCKNKAFLRNPVRAIYFSVLVLLERHRKRKREFNVIFSPRFSFILSTNPIVF